MVEDKCLPSDEAHREVRAQAPAKGSVPWSGGPGQQRQHPSACQRRPTKQQSALAFIIGAYALRQTRRKHFIDFIQRTEETMPTYHVEMMEGRTVEQKKKLVEAITRVSVEILGGQPESVDILITDIKRENWATGGKLWSEPRD
jgi:4-oxalocrotonate tautomerase